MLLSDIKMKVVLVYRKPYPSSQSIEFIYHSLYDEFREQGLPVSEFILPHFSTGLFNRLANTFSLLKYRNKIIHITGDVYYAILGAVFCKRVITLHDLSFLHRTKGLTRWVLKLFWLRLPVRFAHHVTVGSEAAKEDILREINVDPGKIQLIYHFIDPIYQPIPRQFNVNQPRILQVGAAFNKNRERLIASLKRISCVLVIIGKLSAEQERLLSENNISYENYFNISLEQIHQEYVKADMLGFVSTVEGFGMPVLEAQACGLPVLTSNCSSLPEVAGKGALLVDPYDIGQIKAGIELLISDEALRIKLVNAGYENSKKFQKENVAKSYIEMYKNIAEQVS